MQRRKGNDANEWWKLEIRKKIPVRNISTFYGYFRYYVKYMLYENFDSQVLIITVFLSGQFYLEFDDVFL